MHVRLHFGYWADERNCYKGSIRRCSPNPIMRRSILLWCTTRSRVWCG